MLPKEYFKDYELACKCGCGKTPVRSTVEKFYAARIIYGKPVTVTSAARCEAHNKLEGGSPNSAHLTGALDTKVPPEDEIRWVEILIFVGMTGIGINNNVFIHADDQHEKQTLWTY